MDDLGAPSFSLGLDLDFDSDSEPQTATIQEPLEKSAQQSSINKPSEPPLKHNEDFQPQTLDLDLQDSPPILKCLKRGPPSQSSCIGKRKAIQFSPNIDEDIEDFSSQEDPSKDELSSIQNRSAFSSSKFPMHVHRVLSAQPVSKLKVQKSIPASITSTSASLESNSNKLMFPKLTISPLRRFQLLDSDSDDPSSIKDVDKTRASAEERLCNPGQSVTENQQKTAKFSQSTPKIEDLWKNFGPKKTISVATPVLDEFCKEYFSSTTDTNVTQRQEEGLCARGSEACYQKSSISENVEHHWNPANPLPPAYRYFYHDDPRIQELVRNRLPNFSPLGAVDNRGKRQSDAAVIDYISQFGHREGPSQLHGTRNRSLAGSSNRGRNKSKGSNAKEVSQAWVNPKSRASIPRDVGKRRVHVGGNSAGHWFTGQDGRKVYVTKNGQELTGQVAYRHFKKESGGGGFKGKRSRKKATTKKKLKR